MEQKRTQGSSLNMEEQTGHCGLVRRQDQRHVSPGNIQEPWTFQAPRKDHAQQISVLEMTPQELRACFA